MESSLGIIAVMKQAGLEPTADTYTTLLCSYAKVGDIAAIQTTLDECERNELYLLDKDIFDVIYTLATAGHAGHVDALLPRLRKSAGYNQDAVNLILRLTNKGHERTALAVLKTMPRGSRPDGELTDTGAFFVKQLIRAGRPKDSVLSICQELQDTGMNTKAFLVAIEAAVTGGSVDLSVPLLKQLKLAGQPIRQHYFWPLICAQSTAGSEALLDVVRQIQTEFGLSLNGETVRDYLIPNLAERNSDKLIALLRTAGISVSTAVTSTLYTLLTQDRLREAANVATSYNVYYQPGLYRRPLVNALVKTDDVESFVRFVRQMYDSIPRLEQLRQREAAATGGATDTETVETIDEAADETVVQTADGSIELVDPQFAVKQSDVLGQIIFDVLGAVRKNRVGLVTEILRALVAQGLTVSNAQAERIQERLGSELTPEISELLGRLVAGDLEPIPLDRAAARPSGFSHLSVDQLEKLIEQQEARGENSRGLKRFLLSALFRSKDLERTELAIERLRAEGFVMTGGIVAQLIDLLAQHDQTDRALEQFNAILAAEPDFVLDDFKVVRVVGSLVKQNRLADALRFCEQNRRPESDAETHTFNYNSTVWRILNALADSGRAGDLRQLFDQLLSCKLIDANNVLLGPLVKVHLVNDDAPRAVDVFEEICTKYQCTPWKNDLACRLIQAEDAVNLQRLTDLSTNIHGEVNSLYDLVFSFVECGRIRQARKILETPGLRTRPHKINVACERYQQEGKVQPLEGLVEATKDLSHIDRGDIYYNLLLSYGREPQQPEKALGLWTKMQEEDIQPSDAFLTKLAEFLRANDLEVPFVEPEQPTKRKQRPSGAVTKKEKQATNAPAVPVAKKTKAAPVPDATPAEPKSETLTAFKRLLRAGATGDIDATIRAKESLVAGDKISVTDQSVYIELLLNADRQAAADQALLEMLANRQFPIPRIFRFYLNRVADAGHVAQMLQIGEQISAECKKLVSFDNRLCHAYVAAGRTEEYLRGLSEQLDAAETPEQRQSVHDRFPRGGAVGILEKHPELAEQCEYLGVK